MQRYTVTIDNDMMITNIKTEIDVGDGWEVAMPPENSPVRYMFPGRDYICIMSLHKIIHFRIEKWGDEIVQDEVAFRKWGKQLLKKIAKAYRINNKQIKKR